MEHADLREIAGADAEVEEDDGTHRVFQLAPEEVDTDDTLDMRDEILEDIWREVEERIWNDGEERAENGKCLFDWDGIGVYLNGKRFHLEISLERVAENDDERLKELQAKQDEYEHTLVGSRRKMQAAAKTKEAAAKKQKTN
jgi:hypothetical protein